MDNKKESVRRRADVQHYFRFVRRGFCSLDTEPKKRIQFLCLVVLLFVVWFLRFRVFAFQGVFAELLSSLYSVAFTFAAIVIFMVFFVVSGMPKDYKKMQDNLLRVSCFNDIGEIPLLENIACVSDTLGIYEWTFESTGLPCSFWLDHKEEIQSALNIHLISVEYGKDNRHVVCRVISGDHQLQKSLLWNHRYLAGKESELLLGEGLEGPVIVDLDSSPHLLVGGATGSGKTVLLRLLLAQCIAKKHEVIIADFKKVDFRRVWHQNAEVITDEDSLIQRLEAVIEELHRRQQLYQDHDCSNLSEYNLQYYWDRLPRIIVACDEVAELMDTTGASKEQKAKIAEIEKAFATIARQGRAFGIHLVLGTQRPSADVLSGQIKNNITYKCCGRADNTLSIVILDNADAADMIPKTAAGRFLDSNGALFQAYYFTDEDLDGLLEYLR